MKTIRKYLGLLWMLLGPAGIGFLILTAASEIAKKPVLDTKIQWGVFIGVFVPIAFGMMVFGWFAFKEEYNSN